MHGMENCVILCRKSDENAREDDFAIQEDECRAYAAEKGYNVLVVYREAHSGKLSPQTRIVLRQALGDIKSGRAHVLVVRMYDRLARDTTQMHAILYEVEQLYHGRVEAAREQLDRSDPMARLTFTILAELAGMERDKIVTRMEAGRRKRATRGHLMGGPQPRYGYAWLDDVPGERTTYVIDPVTGPVVQRMFTLATQGVSIRAIARILNSEGVPTPSTYASQKKDTGRRAVARFWHAEQVRNILTDKRYAGFPVAFQYQTTREYRDGKEVKVRTRRDDAITLTTDVWPILIQPEQFALAHLRQQTNVAGRKPSILALLRGHVYCGVCGSRMGVSSKGGKYGKPVYLCQNRPGNVASPAEACSHHSMLVTKADAAGWEAVKYLLASREQFVKLLRERFAHPDDGALLASAAGALKEKQDELATLAGSVGLTANETVRQSIVAQMESVAVMVTKLEKQYRDMQKIADSEKATDAWIETTLDHIYNWARDMGAGTDTYPTHEQVAQFDALPFEVRRVAVEASGVRVNLFPTGWLQENLGLPGNERMVVTFEQATDLLGTVRTIEGANTQTDNIR